MALFASILVSPPVQVATRTIKRLPPLRAMTETRRWRSWRHRLTLLIDRREDAIFTRFMRVPTQFDALVGPALDYVAPSVTGRPLRILDIGCSGGAEPYSIASELVRRRPDVAFEVAAYDIRREMLAKAESAVYTTDEVFPVETPPADFVAATFDERDGLYAVKPDITRRVTFGVADAFDPRLVEQTGTADIVFAQNLLYNFPRAVARRAFANLCQLLNPRAVLFIDGVDLDMREKLTREYGLVPLDFRVREIHDDARVIRGCGWPWHYWGLEPFSTAHRDWHRRYATVFLYDRALMV